MKHLFVLALLVLTLFFWRGFANSGKEIERLEQQLEVVIDEGDPEDESDGIKSKIGNAEGQRIFMGLLLSIGSAAAAGIVAWAYVLPFLASRASGAIFEGGDIIEQEDPMRDAHAALAQGNYDGALTAFRKVAANDPTNRLPWVEMAKVYKTNLEDPGGAAAVLREGLEAHEWEEEDACFLLFRLSEIYHEDLGDRETCRAIMQQVIDTFPNTRHSANATHKLNEWNREDEEKDVMDRLHHKGPGDNSLG